MKPMEYYLDLFLTWNLTISIDKPLHVGYRDSVSTSKKEKKRNKCVMIMTSGPWSGVRKTISVYNR